jgi:DNA integrity scanning protein DisA with diadenylate cyclase activity
VAISKQREVVKVKAEEKVNQLKKQLALAKTELVEANTIVTIFIDMEKELIKSIAALCSEASQASTTLKNLST